MPPKFGANLGPNAGAADGSANTFGADNGSTPPNTPTPSDTSNLVDAPTLGTTPTSTDMPTSDNMSASSNTSVSALVGEPANDQNSAFSSPTLAGGQPASGLNTQNPFANKVIASGPDSHPAHTQASGSGDIILNNPKPKDNKKIFVVAGVIGLIIVAFIIVIVSLLSGSSKKSSGIIAAAEQFNQYANYVLYGETGTTLEGEYNQETDYKIVEQFYSDSYDETFWQTAKEKLSAAIVKYESIDETQRNQNLLAYLKSYQAELDFVIGQKTTSEPTEEQVAEKFLAEGAESAQRSVDEFYSLEGGITTELEKQLQKNTNNGDTEENSSTSEIAEDETSDSIDMAYRRARWTMLRAQIESYDLYNRHGCLHSDRVDAVCANMDDNAITRLNDLQETALVSGSLADQIVEDAVKDLAKDCWKISKWYTEEAVLEDEEVEGETE